MSFKPSCSYFSVIRRGKKAVLFNAHMYEIERVSSDIWVQDVETLLSNMKYIDIHLQKLSIDNTHLVKI